MYFTLFPCLKYFTSFLYTWFLYLLGGMRQIRNLLLKCTRNTIYTCICIFLLTSNLNSRTIVSPCLFWILATSHAFRSNENKHIAPVRIQEANIPLIYALPHTLHLHTYINMYTFPMLRQYGKTRNSKEFCRLPHYNYVLNYISSHCCFVTVCIEYRDTYYIYVDWSTVFIYNNHKDNIHFLIKD